MILNINQLKSGINHFEFEEDEPQINHQNVSFDQIKIESTIDKRSRSIVVSSRKTSGRFFIPGIGIPPKVMTSKSSRSCERTQKRSICQMVCVKASYWQFR